MEINQTLQVLAKYNMNPVGTYNGASYSYGTNLGGWPASAMYKFVNGTDDTLYSAYITDSSNKTSVKSIYMSLPEDLRNVIVDTTVISGHGNGDKSNFTSTDKLYLIAVKEIYGTSFTDQYSTAKGSKRQLDYYLNLKVTTSSYSATIKQYNGSNLEWWLRSADSSDVYRFYYVSSTGAWKHNIASNTPYGVSAAFRIG